VDVIQQPNPSDVTIELANGSRLPNGVRTIPPLSEPILQTANPHLSAQCQWQRPDRVVCQPRDAKFNDLQVHWLEQGLEGLKWPSLFVRYQLVWPVPLGYLSHLSRFFP